MIKIRSKERASIYDDTVKQNIIYFGIIVLSFYNVLDSYNSELYILRQQHERLTSEDVLLE